MESPESRHRLGVDQLEDPLLSVGPLDVPRAALLRVVKYGFSWNLGINGSIVIKLFVGNITGKLYKPCPGAA